jgi:hypothetical protein
MEVKLARHELTAKPKKVQLEEIQAQLSKDEGQKIFYFDKENSHKDMMNLIDAFEAKEHTVYFREVRYGLDENDYVYEMHVL